MHSHYLHELEVRNSQRAKCLVSQEKKLPETCEHQQHEADDLQG